MTTAVTPNSTGQFAKIFETDLSISNNYSFILHYAEPKNGVNFDGSGAQELRLSFTADTSRVIIPETVQIVTSPGSSAGEFVLYQLAGNRFAVYHRSNHYWGRIQFRIVFQNSQVPLTDFFNNSPYEVEIGFLARYGSVVEVITPLQNDFSVIRMTTAVTPNSTGQFAKIFETDLSISNNYSFILHYAEPKNGVNFDGSGAQELRLSFTADTSRVIIPETVQIVTSPGSSAGEFVLYQLAGNRFAVYHRSNHYWGRIQFRIVFQNSQVPLTDFFNNSPYEVEIGFLARYGSVVEGGGIIELIETQSTVIKFDSFGGYIHGNTFVITGAMTYDFTGAIRGVVVIVKHRAASFTPPTRSVLVAGYYSPNVDNYIFFELIKKDSGTEVILVTISQNV
jgi:hypothetical protein